MEPRLVVPDALLPVLEALRALEPLFHAAATDATPQRFEALVAPEFWEIGASGRRYSRAFALSVLSERQREPAAEDWDMSELHVSEIAPDTFVLTYTLRQPGRITRRATVWRRRAGRWQAVFHQGTVVVEAQ